MAAHEQFGAMSGGGLRAISKSAIFGVSASISGLRFKFQ